MTVNVASDTSDIYDQPTMAFHWATVTCVLVLWVSGQTADWIPEGPANTNYWSVHVVLGFVLALVLIGRILWRATGGRRLAAADRGALHALAKATHYLLYMLLLVVVGLGLANAFVRGYHLFGIAKLPQLGDRELRRPITNWHGMAANILLGLALFHAAAALVHHYLLRDGLLRRMFPGRKRFIHNS
jgi:cytochrome b561